MPPVGRLASACTSLLHKFHTATTPTPTPPPNAGLLLGLFRCFLGHLLHRPSNNNTLRANHVTTATTGCGVVWAAPLFHQTRTLSVAAQHHGSSFGGSGGSGGGGGVGVGVGFGGGGGGVAVFGFGDVNLPPAYVLSDCRYDVVQHANDLPIRDINGLVRAVSGHAKVTFRVRRARVSPPPAAISQLLSDAKSGRKAKPKQGKKVLSASTPKPEPQAPAPQTRKQQDRQQLVLQQLRAAAGLSLIHI